ncbi:hypothetical protein [uncultured Arcobacter sp.]|uniref:hypothetical protein n=1 Tax=uncultured Arcobacter sp. TaxID=165434 RepID=UPI00262D2C06|nr:hypothetical protein [uncultured Arcobacter sp.]
MIYYKVVITDANNHICCNGKFEKHFKNIAGAITFIKMCNYDNTADLIQMSDTNIDGTFITFFKNGIEVTDIK